MKIFVTALLLAIVGFGAWLFWPIDGNDNDVDIAIEQTPPIVYFSPTDAPEEAAPVALITPTPRVIAVRTPTPTPLGQGGEGPAPVRNPLFVQLSAMNGSGESGTASLTADSDDLAVVSFNLIGAPVNVHQHASIVMGTCSDVGETIYALEPLFNGSSTTTINIDFLEIAQSETRLAIVVFNPENNPNQFPYSCGQLR